MKNYFIVFLLFSFCPQLTFSQMHISTTGRRDFTWNEYKKEWTLTNTEEDYSSFFDFNKDMTMFIHTTSTIKSSYAIKSQNHDKDSEKWEYDIVSDVGNEYYMVIAISKDSKTVGFVGTGKNGTKFLVLHGIKAIWSDDNKNDPPEKTENKADDDYFRQAIADWKDSDYQGSLQNITKYINQHPDNTDAYMYRGFIYLYKLVNYNKAINDYTKVIQLSAKDKEAYYYRAECLSRLEKYYEAIKDYTSAINLDGDYTNAYFSRALTKSKLNDRIGAIYDYDEIINREGEKAPKGSNHLMGTVYNNKGYCLVELGKLEEAMPLLNKALALEPGESYIWSSRGELYFKRGNFQKCIEDMSQAIEIDIKNTSKSKGDGGKGVPFYFRGLAEIKLGLKTEGCSDLSKAGEWGYADAYKAITESCK